ncbi:hypothetical protein C8J56DRAFT_1076013 [Mycena floridula]|nr:hypothetical protein C8J56DRAFT_1076013 [Mycena floridula]
MGKRQKKSDGSAHVNRERISQAHMTNTATGTPAAPKQKTKASSANKPKPSVTLISGLTDSFLAAATPKTPTTDDEGSRFGSFIQDEEDGEVERPEGTISHTFQGKVEGKLQFGGIIAVSESKLLIRKKPTLKDKLVVLMLHTKCGTLPPWEKPSVEDVQAILDKVFPGKGGKGQFVTGIDDVFYRLAWGMNHLNNWQSKLAIAGEQTTEWIIKHNPESFPDAESIKESMAVILKWDDRLRTAPFMWKETDPRNHGFAQHTLIIRILAEHFVLCPGGAEAFVEEDLVKNKPIGALILSMQAFQRSLEFWAATGEYQKPSGKHSEFSSDNWQYPQDINGKPIKYVETLKSWKDDVWASIVKDILYWLDHGDRRGRKKKKGASSRASSQACSAADDDGDDGIIHSDSSDVEEPCASEEPAAEANDEELAADTNDEEAL